MIGVLWTKLHDGIRMSIRNHLGLWCSATVLAALGVVAVVNPQFANHTGGYLILGALLIAIAVRPRGRRRRRYRGSKGGFTLTAVGGAAALLVIDFYHPAALVATACLPIILVGWLVAIIPGGGGRALDHATRQHRIAPDVLDWLNSMSPIEFEGAIAQLFLDLGHETARLTPTSSDYGADVIVDESSNAAIVVQCKLWSKPCGVEGVQQVASARAHYKAPRAILVAPQGFTANALNLASSTGVEMWDGGRLEDEFRLAAQLVHNG